MESITSLFHGPLWLTTQLTNIFIGCALVVSLSPSKIISSAESLHYIMTLKVQQKLPDGGGVTSGHTTLHITSEKGKVLLLLPKKNTKTLRLGLIPIQTFFMPQSPLSRVDPRRIKLGDLLLLIKLALQPRVQSKRKEA